MARYLIPSDASIRAIKPGDPRKRLTDGDGLVLLLFVKPDAHGWRFDYHYAGKRNMLSLGKYPDTTLAIARRKADAARRCFARTREIFEELKFNKIGGNLLRHLSMGMSNDFEAAILEGATMIRIGTLLFGGSSADHEDAEEGDLDAALRRRAAEKP